MSKRAIPCLDFQKFKSGNAEQRAEFSKEIRHAFEEYGFANIGGHSVSNALIENTYRTMADFFALAEETKMKYSIAGIGGQIGYTPFGVEHAAERPQPDLKEFWHFTQTHMNNPDVPEVEDFTLLIFKALSANFQSRSKKFFVISCLRTGVIPMRFEILSIQWLMKIAF